jgi:flagellar basal body-associated protein FliL
MKGYGSFWVLIVLLAVLSVLVHVAMWKWAVMKRIKERAKNAPVPSRKPEPPPAN